MKVGDKIRILLMDGEPRYSGVEGIITHIDARGQLHGTWGGCAVLPECDTFEVITDKNFKSNNSEDKSNKQIEEMAKHCTYYSNGECCMELPHISDCDLMCEMFGVFTNLENADYRKASDVIAEFKELVKQDLLDKGLYLVAVKNALDKAEKQMLGEQRKEDEGK